MRCVIVAKIETATVVVEILLVEALLRAIVVEKAIATEKVVVATLAATVAAIVKAIVAAIVIITVTENQH